MQSGKDNVNIYYFDFIAAL